MDRCVIISHPQHSLNENRSSQLDHAPVFSGGPSVVGLAKLQFNLTATDPRALYCMLYMQGVTRLNGQYLVMNG